MVVVRATGIVQPLWLANSVVVGRCVRVEGDASVLLPLLGADLFQRGDEA